MFQSLREEAQPPKKGRGKKRLRCLQRRKVSGKYDGEVKLIWGMALHSQLGRGWSPHTAQKKESHQLAPVAVLWRDEPLPGALSPACGPCCQPHECPLQSVRQSASLPAQLESTYLLVGSKPHRPQIYPPAPSPFSRSPRGSGWVGQRLPTSSFV